MAEKDSAALRSTGTTILAAGSALEGHLRARGELVIEGAIAGDVVTESSIVIGVEGRVLGEVRGTELRIGGRVDGIVRARGNLRLLGSGRIHGHASYDTLEVERGGLLLGSALKTLPTDERHDDAD
jgi:cytoskeletal protein CcmA (bactofilin family)